MTDSSLTTNGSQQPIMIVKSLDPATGIVQICDPAITLHLTRIPRAFVDPAAIYQFVSPNPAVYLLVGAPTDDEHECGVYVGESGNGAYRLVQHYANKEKVWDVAYVISSDNKAFNKAHARAFEFELFPVIAQHPKVQMTNGEVPTRFELASYDASLVRRSLPIIAQLLVASGFPLAKIALSQTETFKRPDEETIPCQEDGSGFYVFRPGAKCSFPGLYGLARREGRTYILQPGSEVRMKTNSSYNNDNVERQNVLKLGCLIAHPTDPDRRILTQPVRCSSWQAAANALAGALVMNSNYWVPTTNLTEQGLPTEAEAAS